MLGLVIAAVGLLAGCGAAAYEYPPLDPRKRKEPEAGPDDEIYSRDNHYIVADRRVSPATVDFYFDASFKGDQSIQSEVLDFFKIESPWTNNLTVRFLDSQNPINPCGEVAGCSGSGTITISLFTDDRVGPEDDFSKINRLAEGGKILREGTYIHEFSHALRAGIADPRASRDGIDFLEEGMAEYTERSLTSVQPGNVATRLVSQIVDLNEIVVFGQDDPEVAANTFFRSIFVERFNPNTQKVSLASELRSDFSDANEFYPAGSIWYLHIPFNKFVEHMGLYVRVRPSGEKFELEIYSDHTIHDKWDQRLRGTDCLENGFVETLATEDGHINLGLEIPYSTPNERWLPIVGHCFWHQLDSHDAVIRIAQSMATFSREHEMPRGYFPFFNNFVQATNRNQESAFLYFNRFQVPPEDENYILGGVKW